jgi:hypothetical protein
VPYHAESINVIAFAEEHPARRVEVHFAKHYSN